MSGFRELRIHQSLALAVNRLTGTRTEGMRRTSRDYVAVKPDRCHLCGRAILEGMYCCNVVLRNGRKAKVHSLCEAESKKNVEVMRVKGHLLILGTIEEVSNDNI